MSSPQVWGRRDELGADIPFTQGAFIHFRQPGRGSGQTGGKDNLILGSWGEPGVG